MGTARQRETGAEPVLRNPVSASEPVVRNGVSASDDEGRLRRSPELPAPAPLSASVERGDPHEQGAPPSRRFPRVTRDTARPEGGGRAASVDAPAPARQWPILAVLGVVGIGLLLTALDVFRAGTILIGAALLAGAVLRWALPDVGMLAVRSRFTDMVTYGVLGVAIMLLAMMAQPNPWLEMPFLDDTLHFTIRT